MNAVTATWDVRIERPRMPRWSLPALRPRHGFLRVALLLSVLLHAVLFVHWRLTYVPSVPAQPAPVAPIEVALHIMPPVVESQPLPEPVATAPALEPAPIPEPVEQAMKPVQKPKPRPRPTPLKTAPKPQPVQVARPMTVTSTPVTPRIDHVAREHARQSHLARLLAHIESHKFYPLAARRRGVEGVVEVSFTLTADGHIVDARFTGATGVLQRAAEDTLRRASPLPTLPAGIATPYPVRFGMRFALTNGAS